MDVSTLCSDLVKIRSDNPPGDTQAVIGYIRDLLTGRGIRSVVTERARGRCNLVTEPAGTGILFCGHVDVVPALDEGWSFPPYTGAVRKGSVWGRGATDMKGGCASIIGAFFRFIDRYDRIPTQLAFVCDEETGGDSGIRYLIGQNIIKPCDCLIAEPTPAYHPNIGQKGLVRLELRFFGSPAHGSLYPAVGRSAIIEALTFIEYLRSLHRQGFTHEKEMEKIIARSSRVLAEEFGLPQASEILTKIMFNPGVIAGGEKSNIVAQACDLDLEMRIPWGCNIGSLLQDIGRHLPHGTITSQTFHEPSLTDPGSSIVTTTCDAVKRIYGMEASPIVQWAASDARHLRSAGFNVIEYGPGELKTLHAVDEYVTTESLEKASAVYQEIMQAYALPDSG